mgnify:CR=1 FL=1
MFKVLFIIFFIINYSLAFANTISNCSNCGGIGSNLGEVKPKDPFFKQINLSLTCPQQNGSSYKKAGEKVWITDLRGFYNDNYLWVHKLKIKSLKQQARVLIGFKNKNNKLEFDGIDFNFSQKDGASQKRFLGFQEFTKNIPSSISNGIDIERASLSGGKSRICLLKITDLFSSKLDLMGKGQIENSIKVVKKFEDNQFKITNFLSKKGFEVKARFVLTNAITDLAIKIASGDTNIKNNNKDIINLNKKIISNKFNNNINKKFASGLKPKSGFGNKIRPEDPFFYIRNFELRCKSSKTNKSLYNPMTGYINENYLYASRRSRDSLNLAVGYKVDNNKKLRVEVIHLWFPESYTARHWFEVDIDKDLVNTLKKGIEGRRIKNYSYPCTFKLPVTTGSVFPTYDGGTTIKDKKYGLERAINALKSFEMRQYDINNALIKKGENLDFKFELTGLISDLSIKMAMLDNSPKIIIKEDEKSKKLAEKRTKELEKERKLRKAEEIERKILEEKAKKLSENNRLAELNAKKKAEQIAKQVAAEEKKKLDKERALRKAEALARKKAEKEAKKFALEKQLAEEKAKKEAKQRAIRLAIERKKTLEIARKLEEERKEAELKANKLQKAQQTQLVALEKEKAEKQKLILEEKKKREDLEKKFIALREKNKNKISTNKNLISANLPSEWQPFKNDMSLQQKQFCQLTDRFFKNINKAIKSRNEIKVNIVHKERQENLDGLLPGGKVNNWIFQVVKVDQIEDGSAAVVLSLHCKSFVGSGQIHTRSTWRKKSTKEWRATIPYDDRRFRELAKLDSGQFILGSGTFLEINAFKPGQIETFYASQQIGEHPLTKGLELEGELFLADLNYIAALN